MTKEQINSLISAGKFPESDEHRELIETHISWVILGDEIVYKIKKPVYYSFLDFSSVERRKHFCEREIELNKRFTKRIYLDVQPVSEWRGRFYVGINKGAIIDYAVRMNKIDREKQMNVLLLKNGVTEFDILKLAEKIALFHRNTDIIYEGNSLDIQEKFNDLNSEEQFLRENLGAQMGSIITQAAGTSDIFIRNNKNLLTERLSQGYFRDCHGDLHSRNIFLLPEPNPFDCLEFNDQLRQIDVLNEVAFLCMDLDAFDRKDLSTSFIEYYDQFFPSMRSNAEHRLFVYYKSYRANIRAKVNSLRAKSAMDITEKTKALTAAKKYLLLLKNYIDSVTALA